MDTFVVRLWGEEELGKAATPLRGTVLHVTSGRTTPFTSVDELLAFFGRAGVRIPGTCGDPEPRRATAT
jgi:hypothetical protein